MRFKLVENLLNEDIESMKKYYPDIPEYEFMEYIKLDPTYKEGSNNAGKYGKWILELVKRGTFSRKNHIKDLLTRFEQEKKNLINKDIMKYKSVDELEAALDDDNSYSELSNRQKERRIRSSDNLINDAEKVYEDSKWEIWIPKTWEASCTLGKGTSWCTAYSGSSNYYDTYSKDGDLYIIINKTDKNEKYQFHFQSEQYMDKNDEEIDLFEFLYKNKGIYEFFEKQKNINIYPLKYFEEFYKNGTYYYGDFDVLPDVPYYEIIDVVIPNGVTSIGYGAFRYCTELTSVTIQDSVTSIGYEAFYNCTSLSSVVLPDNVQSIGFEAFYGCTNLKKVIYKGTKQQFDKIDINVGNDELLDANIEYLGNKNESMQRNYKNMKIRNLNESYSKMASKIYNFYDSFMRSRGYSTSFSAPENINFSFNDFVVNPDFAGGGIRVELQWNGNKVTEKELKDAFIKKFPYGVRVSSSFGNNWDNYATVYVDEKLCDLVESSRIRQNVARLTEEFNEYSFTTYEDIVSGEIGNMSEAELDKELKLFKRKAKALGLRRPEDLVIYIDEEDEFAPDWEYREEKIVDKNSKLYDADGIKVIYEIINGRSFLYFDSKENAKEYFSKFEQ